MARHSPPPVDENALVDDLYAGALDTDGWPRAFLAVAGMALLSIGEDFTVASGDWIQLAGAFVWGLHVLLLGHVAKMTGLPIFVSSVSFLFAGIAASGPLAPVTASIASGPMVKCCT